ncbi:hypothetical protein [Streptomyces sp. NPDC002491]
MSAGRPGAFGICEGYGLTPPFHFPPATSVLYRWGSAASSACAASARSAKRLVPAPRPCRAARALRSDTLGQGDAAVHHRAALR